MSEKFSISKFVVEYLKLNPDHRFTAREIAIWIMETYPTATQEKRHSSNARKTPLDSDNAMAQQIVAEIGAQRPSLELRHGIRTTEGRPRKYYFSPKTLEEEIIEREPASPITEKARAQMSIPTVESFTEADLYPIFCKYLSIEFSLYSLRIDEKKATNNRGPNGNRWLFPDIVALEDLSAGWDRDVADTVRELSEKKTRLWSFELKLRINASNVRETFFQAVSNSSWADQGYLVAAEIQGGQTLTELRILSALHGIGLIKFDPENPSDSQILIPAADQNSIDWGTVNRLVEQNSDFRRFIKLVRQFYQTGEIHKSLWDGN